MYQTYFKRIFDIILSISLIFILLPILIIIFFVVWHKIGFPIFFQKRPGLNDKIFTLYKFKTLFNAHISVSEKERQSSFGDFLRKTGIDELPQLFNVLKGDMSLVGPRPLLEKYIPLYSTEQFRRHEVQPGITGWAQVNGRNNISWAKKFELDVWYVDNQSFILDLKIFWMTLLKVIKRKDITTEEPRAFQPFNGMN